MFVIEPIAAATLHTWRAGPARPSTVRLRATGGAPVRCRLADAAPGEELLLSS